MRSPGHAAWRWQHQRQVARGIKVPSTLFSGTYASGMHACMHACHTEASGGSASGRWGHVSTRTDASSLHICQRCSCTEHTAPQPPLQPHVAHGAHSCGWCTQCRAHSLTPGPGRTACGQSSPCQRTAAGQPHTAACCTVRLCDAERYAAWREVCNITRRSRHTPTSSATSTPAVSGPAGTSPGDSRGLANSCSSVTAITRAQPGVWGLRRSHRHGVSTSHHLQHLRSRYREPIASSCEA